MANAPYGVGPINRQSVGTSLQGNDEGVLNQTLQDRNLQQFLAQLGAQVGGEGSVGQMLGTTTQQLNRREAQQDAMRQLIKMLGTGGQIKQGADGSIELKAGESQENETNETGGISEPVDEEGYDLDSMLNSLSGMSIE